MVMKFFENGHKRLLSMLLSLVLLVSLVPVIGLPASAEDPPNPPNLICTDVEIGSTYSSGCLKSMTISYHFNKAILYTYAPAQGKFAVHNGATQNENHISGNWSNTETIKSKNNTFVAFQQSSEFWWTNGQNDKEKIYSKTVEFADHVIEPNQEYYLYLWTLANNEVYPDCFFAKIKIKNGELKVVYSQDEDFPTVHTHQWKSSPIDGNGTREASTTISCAGPDCNAPMQVDVSLTASDVTLPGNVFGAKLTVETTENPAVALLSTRAASLPLPGLPEGLKISEPVYKYSATGSGYDPIDPAGFTPKAGYYQASVQILDVNNNVAVADLAVKYTVSDPAVTAATGDNRPIELMILGMAFFCAMAAGAFVLDGRRKVR